MKKFAVEEFRKLARTGERPSGMVLRGDAFAPEPQAGSRKIRFTFSDGSVDRAGDAITQSGWDLVPFGKNPLALWSHDTMSLPIGRASNVGVINDRLVGDIEFAPPDISVDADQVYRLVKGGFVRACSVGFIPTVWRFSTDPKRPNGIDFLKQTLLEISICAIPCNPNSLAEARAKGLPTRLFTISRSRSPSDERARQARMIEARKIAVHTLRHY